MDRVLWVCTKKWISQHFDLKDIEFKALKLENYAAGYHDQNQGEHDPLALSYPFEIKHPQDGHTFGIVVKTKLRDIGKVHACL